MRRRYAVLLGLTLVLPPPAYAVVAVEDVPSLFQQIKNYAIQLQQAKTEADQYITMGYQLNAVAHNPSLGAVAGLIGRTGLGNDMPVNVGTLSSLANGNYTSFAGLTSAMSRLGSLVQTNYDQNHVYTCTNGSAGCAASQANAKSIAGMQGVAQAAQQNLREHLPVMQALRDKLATARDVKDVADIQGQIETEQVWTNNTLAELSAVQANYEVSKASQAQQADEQVDQSFENFSKMAGALH